MRTVSNLVDYELEEWWLEKTEEKNDVQEFSLLIELNELSTERKLERALAYILRLKQSKNDLRLKALKVERELTLHATLLRNMALREKELRKQFSAKSKKQRPKYRR
jgi:hypothetical protein